MGRLLPGARWQPWPQRFPPELCVAAAMPQSTPLWLLPGAAAAGLRGRLGLVAVAPRLQQLPIAPGTVADTIDRQPPDAVRMVLLGFELGAPDLFLPPQAPPRGQPPGLVADATSFLLSDHYTRTFAVVGSGANAALLHAASMMPLQPAGSPGRATLEPQVSDSEHRRRVTVAREQIFAGEIYQANITRRLQVVGDVDPLAALSVLHQRNPVAHAAYLRWPGGELLSNTMETLLTYTPTTRWAQSLPIKGTRARIAGEPRDRQLRRDPKERAEHLMIVDLVRNDLGRVCVPGSVRVPELMGVHGFRGVWHGISRVAGRLHPDHTPGQLVASLFPGGSVTGAPKRRSVRVIRELEGEGRGFYCGSLALLLPGGRLSMSILIRTLVRDNSGWNLAVGGGIVADSDPAREIAETWEKVAVWRELFSG